MFEPKSEFYKLGWWNTMQKLTLLKYKLDQDIYIETIWEAVHRLIEQFTHKLSQEHLEYISGVKAAIHLFEKTGHVPSTLEIGEFE